VAGEELCGKLADPGDDGVCGSAAVGRRPNPHEVADASGLIDQGDLHVRAAHLEGEDGTSGAQRRRPVPNGGRAHEASPTGRSRLPGWFGLPNGHPGPMGCLCATVRARVGTMTARSHVRARSGVRLTVGRRTPLRGHHPHHRGPPHVWSSQRATIAVRSRFRRYDPAGHRVHTAWPTEVLPRLRSVGDHCLRRC
jgi:hypothetical protein